MSAHTPGPWRVGMNNGSNANIVTAGDDVGVATIGGIYMHRRIDEVEHEPACQAGLANARLIAAAPDLLEALVALRAEVQSMAARVGWAGMGAREKANRAIAKAEGSEYKEPIHW